MDCFEEEIFGPVVSVRRFDREEEAIAIAVKISNFLSSSTFTHSLHSPFQNNENNKIKAGPNMIWNYFQL